MFFFPLALLSAVLALSNASPVHHEVASGSVTERAMVVKHLPKGLPRALVDEMLKMVGVHNAKLLSIVRVDADGNEADGPYVCVFESHESVKQALANKDQLADKFGGVELFGLEEDLTLKESTEHNPVVRVNGDDLDDIRFGCVHIVYTLKAGVDRLNSRDKSGDYCLKLSVFLHGEDPSEVLDEEERQHLPKEELPIRIAMKYDGEEARGTDREELKVVDVHRMKIPRNVE